MLRLLAILLGVLLALTALLWSHGAATGTADLRYVSATEMRTLDPQRASWLEDIRVIECVFEGLVRAEVPGLKIGPATAASWDVSPDKLTYTFHLRPEARWSNGEAVTADDFRFAWMRLMLPDSAADYSQLAMAVRGAQAFFDYRAKQLADYASEKSPTSARAMDLWHQARAQFNQTVGLTAPDEHTLVVTLERPCAYFLEVLGFIAFVPVHQASVEPQMRLDPVTGMMVLDPMWTRPDRLIGNGPYNLARRRFKRDILLTANEHYWNRAALRNHSILMLILDNQAAAMLAYQRGEVDWLPDIPTASPLAADLMQQSRQGQRDDVHTCAAAGTYFYNFNCAPNRPDGSPNPLHDPRVRRALALTIDRQTIVERVTRSYQPVALTFIPPGALPGYDPPVDSGAGFDPVTARALLAQAGYPGGQGLTGLSILYNNEGAHAPIAQAIKNQWERELGVSVTLEGVEKSVFGQRLRSHDFSISRAGWFGDYRDPTTFLDKFASDNGNNDGAYNNPAYDDLLRQAAGELDAPKRLHILEQAEALMLADQPIAPIYHYSVLWVSDPRRVVGLDPNPWQLRRFEFVEVRHGRP